MKTPEGITIPEKYQGELRVWFVRGTQGAIRGAISPQEASEANLIGKHAYDAWLAGVEAGKAAVSEKEAKVAGEASSEGAGLTGLQGRLQELEEMVAAEKAARIEAEKQASAAQEEAERLKKQVENESAARQQAEREVAAAKEEIERLKNQLDEKQSKGFADRLLGR